MFIKDGAFEGVDPHEYFELDSWEREGNGTWYANNIFQVIVECFRLSYPKTYHKIRHIAHAFLKVNLFSCSPMNNETAKRAFDAYLSDEDKFVQDLMQFDLIGFEDYRKAKR